MHERELFKETVGKDVRCVARLVRELRRHVDHVLDRGRDVVTVDAEPPEEPDDELIEQREADALGEAHERCLNDRVDEVIERGLAEELAIREERREHREHAEHDEHWYENGERLRDCRRHRIRHLDADLLVLGELDEDPGSDRGHDDGRKDCLVAEVIEAERADLVAGLADDLLRRDDDVSAESRQRRRELIAAPDAAEAIGKRRDEQEGKAAEADRDDVVAEALIHLHRADKARCLVSVARRVEARERMAEVQAVRAHDRAPGIDDNPLNDTEERADDDERQEHGESVTHREQVLVAGNLSGNRHHDALKAFNKGIHSSPPHIELYIFIA